MTFLRNTSPSSLLRITIAVVTMIVVKRFMALSPSVARSSQRAVSAHKLAARAYGSMMIVAVVLHQVSTVMEFLLQFCPLAAVFV